MYAKMVSRNRWEQQRDARLGAVAGFCIQNHYGDAAASLLTWPRTLRLLFISKSKIGSERTPFCVNRRHLEVRNAGLKKHPTNRVPGMLQTVAAPLDKVCAGTWDVLWRWPHCSWWIDKIKLSFWYQDHHYFSTSYILKFIERKKGQNVTAQLSLSVTCCWEQLLCLQHEQLD